VAIVGAEQIQLVVLGRLMLHLLAVDGHPHRAAPRRGKIASKEFPAGMVVDTRELPEELLAAIAPAMRKDSGAKDMQHNGVVRDFRFDGQG
jgi:hypothetical protein